MDLAELFIAALWSEYSFACRFVRLGQHLKSLNYRNWSMLLMQLQSQVKFRLSHEMKSGLVYDLEDSMLPQELADDSFRYKRLVYVNNIISY